MGGAEPSPSTSGHTEWCDRAFAFEPPTRRADRDRFSSEHRSTNSRKADAGLAHHTAITTMLGVGLNIGFAGLPDCVVHAIGVLDGTSKLAAAAAHTTLQHRRQSTSSIATPTMGEVRVRIRIAIESVADNAVLPARHTSHTTLARHTESLRHRLRGTHEAAHAAVIGICLDIGAKVSAGIRRRRSAIVGALSATAHRRLTVACDITGAAVGRVTAKVGFTSV